MSRPRGVEAPPCRRRWGIPLLCLLLWGGDAVPGRAAEDAPPPPPAVSAGVPGLMTAAPGQDCGDPLRAADIRPAGLEFLFCRREEQGGQARFTARYRVRGSEAARVERLLHERCGMGMLVRSLGIWSVPDGAEGRLPDGAARVSMGEVPQPGTFAADRAAWDGIAWFAVRVDSPLPGSGQTQRP